MIGSAVGPYQVLEELGAGGMGDVFLGYDTRLQRRVALKCLTPQAGDQEAQIFREARAAARLNHPNIAAIYDVIEHDHQAFIVMEYVDGENLAQRLKRDRPPIEEVRRIARQIALALIAAHEQGVIHRDIKPANIHLTRDGSIKVLDFGVAKLIPAIAVSADADTGPPVSGAPAGGSPGTPIYMAPEQLFDRPVDARSDIYSAGVVLFELATGRRPYLETDPVALALAITGGPAPAAHTIDPAVPLDLSDTIARALEREPGRRFESARDFARALAATDDAPTTRGADNVATDRTTRADVVAPGWRRYWKPALAMGLLLVVGAAARDPLVTRFGLSKVRLLRSATASKPLVLAILPVGNPTLDPQGEFLGAGIRSAVAGNFGAVGGITVLPRTDTAAYRKDRVDVAGLQRDLGATHVIDLSLVAVKPTPRLEARLYRAGGAKVEWEDTIEGDPLSIERTVLNDLARALETSALPRLFTADEWTRIQRLPTSSGAAFAAYSEAIALVARDPVENAAREIALLQVATEIDPRFAIAWATLGNAWWDKYQRDKDPALASNAIAAVDRAIALDANQADVHYALGIIRYRTGRLNEAVASFRAALNLRPEFDDAHRLLGEVLSTLGQVDAAEAELRTAIRIHKSWNNYFSLGTIDYRAGRYPQAADAFTQATELAPLNAGAFQMLGTTYYVLGDIQKAIGNFEHAVRLGPSASAYANLGMAYYESNKLDEARRSYDESLQRDPKSALNHRNLGDVYRRLGRMRDARAQYEQAIALAASLLSVNPRDVRAISLVAVCEAKLGRAAAAARHAAEAVALEPANRQALQRSAEVHALLNQPDAALRDLQAAIAHGFDPRMARNDDELASLRRLPRFEEILKASPGNPSATQGARE